MKAFKQTNENIQTCLNKHTYIHIYTTYKDIHTKIHTNAKIHPHRRTHKNVHSHTSTDTYTCICAHTNTHASAVGPFLERSLTHM